MAYGIAALCFLKSLRKCYRFFSHKLNGLDGSHSAIIVGNTVVNGSNTYAKEPCTHLIYSKSSASKPIVQHVSR